MTDPSDPKTLWQAQDTEGHAMTLADIHAKAGKFQAQIRSRNMREYVGAAFVAAVFGWIAVVHPEPWSRAGCLATIAATIYVVWQLHRRGSAKSLPSASNSIADFHHDELVRQRDVAKAAWRWYLLPFAPGIVLMGVGRWLGAPILGRSLEADRTIIVLAAIIVALIFVAIALMNAWGASKLQRQIDELDAQRR